jgi:hypothetical protein
LLWRVSWFHVLDLLGHSQTPDSANFYVLVPLLGSLLVENTNVIGIPSSCPFSIRSHSVHVFVIFWILTLSLDAWSPLYVVYMRSLNWSWHMKDFSLILALFHVYQATNNWWVKLLPFISLRPLRFGALVWYRSITILVHMWNISLSVMWVN